jgi:hypothetical protein
MLTNPINISSNLVGVLYFGIFFKKLYLQYIGTEGVFSSETTKRTAEGYSTEQPGRHVLVEENQN